MISTVKKNEGFRPTKKKCPKCGALGVRIKKSCCAERRRGIKGTLICPRCGYREKIK